MHTFSITFLSWLSSSATASIAKSYNMHAVAEDVKIQDILDCVKELNIDQVQGYLLHKPQSFEDLMNAEMLQLT